jgi:hypothetical protein
VASAAAPSEDRTAPRPSALRALRVKYAVIVELRLAHAAGTEDPRAVRPRLAALAREFPGALREIDRLALDELRRRIAELDSVVAGEREHAPWMAAVALFHELLRGALCAKRWMSTAGPAAEDARRAFEADMPAMAFPDDARRWVDELDAIASPPRGRLTELVLARIATTMAMSLEETRALVLPRRAPVLTGPRAR